MEWELELALTETALFTFSLLLRPSERTLEGRIREVGLVVGVLGKPLISGMTVMMVMDVVSYGLCLDVVVLYDQEDHGRGW